MILAFRVILNGGKLEICSSVCGLCFCLFVLFWTHHWGTFLLDRGPKILDGTVLPMEDLARKGVVYEQYGSTLTNWVVLFPYMLHAFFPFYFPNLSLLGLFFPFICVPVLPTLQCSDIGPWP